MHESRGEAGKKKKQRGIEWNLELARNNTAQMNNHNSDLRPWEEIHRRAARRRAEKKKEKLQKEIRQPRIRKMESKHINRKEMT